MKQFFSALQHYTFHSCVLIVLVALLLLGLHFFSVVWVNVSLVLFFILLSQFILFLLFLPSIFEFSKNPKNTGFVYACIGFIVFSLIYVVIGLLLLFGSPFVYEDTVPNLRRVTFVEHHGLQVITFEYHAKVNNLGSITIPFSQLQSMPELLSDHNVQFTIGYKNQQPFHTSEHFIVFQEGNSVYAHPFGFPIQNQSKDSTYEITLQINNLGVGTDTNQIIAAGKYVVPLRDSISQLGTAASIMWIKSHDVLQNQLIYILVFMSFSVSLGVFVWHRWHSWVVLFKIFGILSISCWAVLQFFQYVTPWRLFSDVPLVAMYYALFSTIFVIAWLSITNTVTGFASSITHNLHTLQKSSSKLAFGVTKIELMLLLISMCIAFSLRLPHLEALDPYTDEYLHLVAGKQLVDGIAMHEVYERGLYIVTIPIALAFKLFGTELWVARSVGVLFNVLAILPLFLILRRFSLGILIAGLLLFATNPWLIAVSRNVREYAYYPFYFYSVLYAMILLYERIPSSWSINGLVTSIVTLKSLGLLGFLVGVLGFFMFGDPYSTGKVLLIAYVVFALLIVFKMDWHSRTNLLLVGIGSIGSIAALVWFSVYQNFVSILPSFNSYWVGFFIPVSSGQWYYDLVPFAFLALPAMAVMYGWLIRRRSAYILFFCALFFAYWYFYLFHFDRYSRPRYGMSMQFWYILVMAIGLGGFWELVKNAVQKKWMQYMLLGSILLVLVNPAQVILPMQMDTHGYVPITNEYHDNMKAVHEFMKQNVQEGDVLVHTIYNNYAIFKGDLLFNNVINYSYRNHDTKFFITQIHTYDSGWVVLDNRRGKIWNNPIPNNSIIDGDKQLKLVDTIDGFWIYYWGATNM